MSSNDVAISVRDLGKSYTIRHNAERHTMLAEAVASRIQHPLRRSRPEEFWALKDVTFNILQGEVVGIVGRNGAGKSTLLKVLSRITTPTTGEVHLYGRVGSLLEVGTGFHPELTGRENIFLNGAILGMRRRDIARRFDAIVAFAGVEHFLDTPVKRYSSGMSVRLAFSVAAHLDTDLLLVDEVLAVGDHEFQTKCLDRMRDVAAGGRTVVFVSHNLQAIRELCSRAIWIAAGCIADDGDSRAVLARYLDDFLRSPPQDVSSSDGPAERTQAAEGSGEFVITDVSVTPASAPYDQSRSILVHLRCDRKLDGSLFVAVGLREPSGQLVASCDSRLHRATIRAASGSLDFCFDIHAPWLTPGKWTLDVRAGQDLIGWVDVWTNAHTFEVADFGEHAICLDQTTTPEGLVVPDFEVTFQSRQ